jgi:hypothetical protein
MESCTMKGNKHFGDRILDGDGKNLSAFYGIPVSKSIVVKVNTDHANLNIIYDE